MLLKSEIILKYRKQGKMGEIASNELTGIYQFSDHNLKDLSLKISQVLNWIERRTCLRVYYYILNQRIVQKHQTRRANNQGDK